MRLMLFRHRRSPSSREAPLHTLMRCISLGESLQSLSMCHGGPTSATWRIDHSRPPRLFNFLLAIYHLGIQLCNLKFIRHKVARWRTS